MFVIVLLSGSHVSHAQQFNFKTLSVNDGLAQSQVYALLQDQHGYIWMGTRGGGLCSYDGVQFRTYSTNDGLVDNYILSLFEDSKGKLWIGTNRGLSVFNGIEFRNHEILPGIEVSVECIGESDKGKIWLGTSYGLMEARGDSLIPYQCNEPWCRESIYDLAFSNGRMYGGTDYGMFCLTQDSLKTFTTADGLPSNLINCLEVIDDGTIWVSVYGQGVQLFNDTTFQEIDGLDASIVFDIELSDNADIWLGSLNNGAIVFREGSFTAYNEDEGLATNQVRSVLSDDWGNVWLGTSGGGVCRFSGQQFHHINRNNGLPARQVYSIEERDSVLFLGLSSDGLFRYDLETREFEQDTLLNSGKVKALFIDSRDRLWAGTEGQGLHMIAEDTSFHFTRNNLLNNNWVKAIQEDSFGRYWVATSGGGINRLTPKDSSAHSFGVDVFSRANGMLEDRITDLVIDGYDRIWYSTLGSGIGVILQDETVLSFGADQGLSTQSVRSLALDSLGWLWVGTAGGGIDMLNLNADTLGILHFEPEIADINDNVYFLQFDDQQHLWIGTAQGVDKVVLDENRNALDFAHFGVSEGFEGIETTTNASLRTPDGKLWFGTIDGLSTTNPYSESSNPYPPRTFISGIKLFYESLANTPLAHHLGDWGTVLDTLVLTHEQNHLDFEFVGVNLKNPEQVSYQWKLMGWEDDWSPLTGRSSITYSNLGPGEYEFVVRACNQDGICDPNPPSIHFTVLRPFWQELWFLLVCIGAGVLVIVIIFWARVGTIKRRARERSNRLELEKSVVELEQKALRLQMNPHFIFNTLNSIQGLIATQDSKTARLYLSKFSKLMRETLENSRESLVSVEEEASALKHYLDLEKFSHGDVFDYEISIGEGTELYNIPPLVVQPFAENAIIHGLIPLGGEGKLVIRFREEHRGLVIEIEDNGVGRKAAAENKAQKTNYHKSTGLQVTQERLDMMNENGNKSIEFVDLHKEGVPNGTLVRLLISGSTLG